MKDKFFYSCPYYAYAKYSIYDHIKRMNSFLLSLINMSTYLTLISFGKPRALTNKEKAMVYKNIAEKL